jgi:hypothetical protein
MSLIQGIVVFLVIHYTRTIENLKDILSEGFRVKYCLEQVTGVPVPFPMVSFCDIPLSNALYHSSSYGEFAIGLTKDWAYANNLNPVLYISDNSYPDKQFKKQSDRLNQDSRDSTLGDWLWLKNFTSVLSFAKSVNGQIIKNGEPHNINHYNERE